MSNQILESPSRSFHKQVLRKCLYYATFIALSDLFFFSLSENSIDILSSLIRSPTFFLQFLLRYFFTLSRSQLKLFCSHAHLPFSLQAPLSAQLYGLHGFHDLFEQSGRLPFDAPSLLLQWILNLCLKILHSTAAGLPLQTRFLKFPIDSSARLVLQQRLERSLRQRIVPSNQRRVVRVCQPRGSDRRFIGR